jgi:GDP-L-fucose synthase
MSYKGQRVLVAGSTGLAGMALTRRLAEAGASVRATVFRTPPAVKYPGVEYVQADLTLKEDCRRAAQGIDLAFIAAATSSGAAKISTTPLIHVTPNIVLNALLLEECYHAKVKKTLYMSSTTSYPDAGARPLKEEELFDGDPYEVYFPVGWMKRYTEVLCRMYSTKLKPPMCAQVVRPTNIYGPFDDFAWETSHVLAALIRKVVERHDPIEVWGTGDDVRDLVYVEDFAEACLTVLEKSGGYDPVNVGLGKGYSVKEMLKVICEVDGYEGARVVFNASKPSMIPVRLVDVSKAEKQFGFRAKTDLREGVARTVRWYRENASLVKK